MKIAIVGGGVSGLLAAYELNKKGFDCTLLEESGYTGGRFEHAVKGMHADFHPEFYNIIDELGLSSSLVNLKKIGFLTDEGVQEFPGFSKLIENLSAKDKETYRKLKKDASDNYFHPFNPSEDLLKFRKISSEEYLENPSDEFLKSVIYPILSFTFMNPIDLSRISAEYLLFKTRLFSELSRENSQTFSKDEGIKVVTNVLERKIRKAGVNINLSTRVTGLDSKKRKTLHYESAGKKDSENFDVVVFATPLPIVEKMLSKKIGEAVSYEKTEYFSLDGDFKSDKDIILSDDKDSNIKVFFSVYHKEQQIFPERIGEEINFDLIYKDYTLFEKTEEKYPFPIIDKNAIIPNQKIEEGIYLCGDYYHYPYIETAVVTAKRVSDTIARDN